MTRDAPRRADKGETVEGSTEISDYLRGLPGQTTHAYEQAMTKIAAELRRSGRLGELEDIVRSDGDRRLRYAAFYCLCTAHRTSRDYSELAHLMAESGAEFRKQPSFAHLDLLSRVGNRSAMTDALFVQDAYDNALRHPGSAGYVHMYAGAFAAVAEALEGAEDTPEWLEAHKPQALDAARTAVRMEPTYAKFHSTLARLLSLTGSFEEANRELEQAVDLEDSSRADYPLRISHYDAQRVRNALRRTSNVAKRAVDKAQADAEARFQELSQSLTGQLVTNEATMQTAVARVDNASIRNLEFLGFFAAIISFVIGTIQIATSFSVNDAARLIVVLMGSLMAVFAAFHLLLSDGQRRSDIRGAIVFSVGVASCLGAWLI